MKITVKQPKRRNWVAKDLLTPKYRMRVEIAKVKYSRKEKHRGRSISN